MTYVKINSNFKKAIKAKHSKNVFNNGQLTKASYRRWINKKDSNKLYRKIWFAHIISTKRTCHLHPQDASAQKLSIWTTENYTIYWKEKTSANLLEKSFLGD